MKPSSLFLLQKREKLNKSFAVDILGNFLSPAGAVKNLGVWFESEMICTIIMFGHFCQLIQKEAQNLSLCTSISTLIYAFPGFFP